MRTPLWLGIGCALLLGPSPISAQDTLYTAVDRIAAIVGNRIIPITRLDEEINLLRAAGRIPDDPAAIAEMRREVLDQLVNQELMVQAALRDTMVVVQEQEVQAAVERAYQEVRNQYPSETAFRGSLTEAGFATPDEYRRWLSDQQRRELLQQKWIQVLSQKGEYAPLAPTEEELRAFFEETRAQQPRRPAMISFRQIVVPSEGDSAAVEEAFRVADSLARELRGDAEFEVVARRFSDDAATREQGGELGWVRRGLLVPEFERVAFRLRPGVISNPILTEFGFHIIQVQRSQPAEVQVRHILIAPEVTEADRQRARERAEAVAQALLNGAPYDSLADLYHDRTGQEQRVVDGYPIEELPAVYRDALGGVAEGSVVGPLVLDRGDGRPKYAVVQVQEIRPEGEYSFEDIRTQLHRMLSEQHAMDRLIRSLRAATYVEIRH